MCIRDRLGIEGIEIEDNIPLTKEDQADMFIDFLPELPPDEGISHVSFYKMCIRDRLGGFYPELYAKELSENVSMLNAIKKAFRGVMPTVAECGVFMYLHA